MHCRGFFFVYIFLFLSVTMLPSAFGRQVGSTTVVVSYRSDYSAVALLPIPHFNFKTFEKFDPTTTHKILLDERSVLLQTDRVRLSPI
jgi:hypothetical protein